MENSKKFGAIYIHKGEDVIKEHINVKYGDVGVFLRTDDVLDVIRFSSGSVAMCPENLVSLTELKIPDEMKILIGGHRDYLLKSIKLGPKYLETTRKRLDSLIIRFSGSTYMPVREELGIARTDLDEYINQGKHYVKGFGFFLQHMGKAALAIDRVFQLGNDNGFMLKYY